MTNNADKKQNEFILISKAKDLVKHTFIMTSEKRFPKKYRFTIVNRIQQLVIDIYECIAEANELDIFDNQEKFERLKKQKEALTKCKTVLFLIELSLEQELITTKQSGTWSGYVFDVKYMTARWNKQDRQRIKGK